MDAAAMAMPYVPAGASKIRNAVDTGAKAAKVLERAAAATKTADNTAVSAKAVVGVKAPKTLEPGPYAGESIPARGPDRDFTRAERDAINGIGAKSGCHTCGAKQPGTKSGDFVPDHQPPSKLEPGAPQQLYPHCKDCSSLQGGEVNGALRRGEGGG
jgi:hypothetical protein